MKKKILSMLLVGAMTIGTLSGVAACGDKKTADEGTYELTMQVVSFGEEFEGLEDVENQINEITEPEIGVKVTLEPIACWDLISKNQLDISTGEASADLIPIVAMSANMDSVSSYVAKNMLTSLNDLYAEYGNDISSCVGNLIELGYVGENLYAIPANYYAGSGRSFLARTDLLEEMGVADQFADETKTHTVDELEALFAAYTEKYGKGYYAIAGFGDGDLTGDILCTDDLGSPCVGSLMNGGVDNTTVVNKYATEEYRAILDRIRQWNLAGYINSDVTQITDTWISLVKTGNYLGAFCKVQGTGLEGVPMNELSCGYDLTVIRLADKDTATSTIASYGLWAIPVTCKNPEKAMQFLNMLYAKDSKIDDILSAGVEGKYYEVEKELSDGRKLIKYADGVDPTSMIYTGKLPVYGNALTTPKMAPVTEEIFDEIIVYNDSLEYSKAFGYSFDSSNYGTQISQINAVLEQYRTDLVWGTVDVDEVLPQFLAALEQAGINEVIQANQEQLDKWLELQK